MADQKIFTPFQIADKQLKNRIALAPMTRGRSDATTGVPYPYKEEYYSVRSDALLISEGTFINDAARGWYQAPGIYTDEQEAAWKSIIDGVKASNPDTVFFCQLWHTGRASHPDLQGGNQPIAASAIAINPEVAQCHLPTGKADYPVPREATVEELEQTIEDFKNASLRAINAGFDGVEIHSANGYFLNTFLDARSNQRTDKYGGSKEARFLFPKQVVEGVLEVLPASKVAIRLSPNGAFNDMGSESAHDDFIYYISQLEQYNLGYLHVMDGLGFGFHGHGDPLTLSEIKEVYSGVVMANCGYEFETAATAVENDLADIVAFGRAFLNNPDLIAKFKTGTELKEPLPYELWYLGDEEGYINQV